MEPSTFLQDENVAADYYAAMHSVSQQQASEANPVSQIERTRFWRDDRFRAMECLTASFITHEFSPHSHDTFSIGAIENGCQVASIRGTREATGPGALYLINPGEVHDGQPGEPNGYRYRMIYPDTELLVEIIEDVTGISRQPQFRPAVADRSGTGARLQPGAPTVGRRGHERA